MSETVAERRRKCVLGELPPDFLRLAVAGPAVDQTAAATLQQQEAVLRQAFAFIPPNTRGRLAITIHEANLVKNYGLVRMDPYCRVRVGNAVFDTPSCISGSRQPKWNKTVNFYLPYNVESIYVQIFDEKTFSPDECIAWAHIMLPPQIFDGVPVDDFYKLSGQQGEQKEGLVHIIMHFTPVQQPAEGVVTPSAESADLQAAILASQQEQQSAPPPQPVELSTADLSEIEGMFPSIDKEVIKCVLEERRGDKHATVCALLEMTSADK